MFVPSQTPVTGSLLVITSPPSRKIYQRVGPNTATVPISGTVTLSYDTAQYQYTPLSGFAGVSSAWTTFYTQSAGTGGFSGNALNVPGGWYLFSVRTQLSGVTREQNSTAMVGVGEIFIGAGQSMLVNVETNPNLVSLTYNETVGLSTGTFSIGNDPQPGSDGTGGSLWPMFMGQLSAYLGVPVAVLSVARGGTFLASWIQGAGNYTTYLLPAIQTFGVNGFRAMLWSQGQSDSSPLVLTQAQYYAYEVNMISNSRIDGGWNFPWLIAESTHFNGANCATIQDGQVQAQSYANCFPGANEDSLGDSYRQNDQTHFSNTGGISQAALWVAAVKTAFGW